VPYSNIDEIALLLTLKAIASTYIQGGGRRRRRRKRRRRRRRVNIGDEGNTTNYRNYFISLLLFLPFLQYHLHHCVNRSNHHHSCSFSMINNHYPSIHPSILLLPSPPSLTSLPPR